MISFKMYLLSSLPDSDVGAANKHEPLLGFLSLSKLLFLNHYLFWNISSIKTSHILTVHTFLFLRNFPRYKCSYYSNHLRQRSVVVIASFDLFTAVLIRTVWLLLGYHYR